MRLGTYWSATNFADAASSVHQTICVGGWTATIRPPDSYTKALRQQLVAMKAKDRDETHYEEDHFISLELGGHPQDP